MQTRDSLVEYDEAIRQSLIDTIMVNPTTRPKLRPRKKGKK